MKTIERLRELVKSTSANPGIMTLAELEAWADRRDVVLDALPALLAAVEAAEKLVALRRTDQSLDWLEKELETEAQLDAALRALEGGE